MFDNVFTQQNALTFSYVGFLKSIFLLVRIHVVVKLSTYPSSQILQSVVQKLLLSLLLLLFLMMMMMRDSVRSFGNMVE